MSAPQTSVTLNSPLGKVGMLADNEPGMDIISAVASADIPIGSYVEITYSTINGQFLANRPVYGGATLGQGGVALLESAKIPALPTATAPGTLGLHPAGTVFSVLRRGRCFALCDSTMTEVGSYDQGAHVLAASTTVTTQGSFTTAAASAVDNSEVADTLAMGTPCRFVRPIDKANGLCLIEVG